MAYILDPISIATSGYIGPIPSSSDQCPAPIAIGTYGYVRFAFVDQVGMADPWSGPSRFTEPFDRGYYLWKYGNKSLLKTPVLTREEPELARPEVMQELLERAQLQDRLALLEAKNRQTEIDILALETYITEVGDALESGLADQLAAEELETERQLALIERLEQNVRDAREALILALDRKTRRNNQQAAMMAVIQTYY